MYACPLVPLNCEKSISIYVVFSALSNTNLFYFSLIRGTGITGLTRGLATLPQGNQEPSVDTTRMEDPTKLEIMWVSKVSACR